MNRSVPGGDAARGAAEEQRAYGGRMGGAAAVEVAG